MNDNPRLKYEQDQQLIDDPATDGQARQAARLRQMFWQARYRPVRHSDLPADMFLALWANMVLDLASRRWFFPRKQIIRNLSRVFDQPSLREALAAAGAEGETMLLAELKDSARLYFSTCQKDTNYSSVLFNLIRMKDEQVAAKAASGAVEGILAPLLQIGETPWLDEMIAAVCSAYPEVFPGNAGTLDNKINELKPAMVERIMLARNRVRQTIS